MGLKGFSRVFKSVVLAVVFAGSFSDAAQVYGTIYKDCRDIKLHEPNATSGNYYIKPKDTARGFIAYCDMDLDGGGWTMIESASRAEIEQSGNFFGFSSNMPHPDPNSTVDPREPFPSSIGYRLSRQRMRMLVDLNSPKNTEWMMRYGDSTASNNYLVVNDDNFKPTEETYNGVRFSTFAIMAGKKTDGRLKWYDGVWISPGILLPDLPAHMQYDEGEWNITKSDYNGHIRRWFVRTGGRPNVETILDNCDEENNVIQTANPLLNNGRSLCVLDISTDQNPIYRNYIMDSSRRYLLAARIRGAKNNWRYDSLLWTSGYGINYDNRMSSEWEYKSSLWTDIPFQRIGLNFKKIDSNWESGLKLFLIDNPNQSNVTLETFFSSMGDDIAVSNSIQDAKNLTNPEKLQPGCNKVAFNNVVSTGKLRFGIFGDDSGASVAVSPSAAGGNGNGNGGGNNGGGNNGGGNNGGGGGNPVPIVPCPSPNSFIGLGASDDFPLMQGNYKEGWGETNVNAEIWIKPSDQYLDASGEIKCVVQDGNLMKEQCSDGYYENQFGECQILEQQILKDYSTPAPCGGEIQRIDLMENMACVVEKGGSDHFYHVGDVLGDNGYDVLFQLNDKCEIEKLVYQMIEDSYTETENQGSVYVGTYVKDQTYPLGTSVNMSGEVFNSKKRYMDEPMYAQKVGFYEHALNGKCIDFNYQCEVGTGGLEGNVCYQDVYLKELPEYKSCVEYKEANPDAQSGVYQINPRGYESIDVYCDMDENFDGGGWTLISAFVDGSRFGVGNKEVFETAEYFGSLGANGQPTQDFKSEAYSKLPFSQIAFVRSDGSKVSYVTDSVVEEKSFRDWMQKSRHWTEPYGSKILHRNEALNILESSTSCADLSVSFNMMDPSVHSLDSLCPGVVENGACYEWHIVPKVNSACPDNSWTVNEDDSCEKKFEVNLSTSIGDQASTTFGPVWMDESNGCAFFNSASSAVNRKAFNSANGEWVQMYVRERAPVIIQRTCTELKQKHKDLFDGVHTLYPIVNSPRETYCDISSPYGPWTLVGKVSPADENGVVEPGQWFREGYNQAELARHDENGPKFSVNSPISGFGTQLLDGLFDEITQNAPERYMEAKLSLVPNGNLFQSRNWYVFTKPEEFKKWFVDGETAEFYYMLKHPDNLQDMLEQCISQGGITKQSCESKTLYFYQNKAYEAKYGVNGIQLLEYKDANVFFNPNAEGSKISITNMEAVSKEEIGRVVSNSVELESGILKLENGEVWNAQRDENASLCGLSTVCGQGSLVTSGGKAKFNGLTLKDFSFQVDVGVANTGLELNMDGSANAQYSGIKTFTQNYNNNSWEDGYSEDAQEMPDWGSGMFIWLKEANVEVTPKSCLNTQIVLKGERTYFKDGATVENLNGCKNCGIKGVEVSVYSNMVKVTVDAFIIDGVEYTDHQMKGASTNLPITNAMSYEYTHGTDSVKLSLSEEGILSINGFSNTLEKPKTCSPDAVYNETYAVCVQTENPGTSQVGASASLSFQDWVQNGGYQDGDWNIVNPDATDVEQILDSGNPTYFISTDIYKYGVFEGEMEISDNDMVGFTGMVFGYKDDTHFYLIDWLGGAGPMDARGFSLFKYNGATPNAASVYPDRGDGALEQFIQGNYNPMGGWDPLWYDIKLEINPSGYVAFYVREKGTGLPYAEKLKHYFDTTNGVPAGRIGFYNNTVQNISFKAFSESQSEKYDCSYLGEGWYLNESELCEKDTKPFCDAGYLMTDEGFCVKTLGSAEEVVSNLKVGSICDATAKDAILQGSVCVTKTACLSECSSPELNKVDDYWCRQILKVCPAGYAEDIFLGDRCSRDAPIWTVSRSFLKCSNGGDTLYGEVQDDNLYCDVEVVSLPGQSEEIYQVEKQSSVNIPFETVERISGNFQRPLYLYAIDSEGRMSMDVKRASMIFSYAKHVPEEREYSQYTCRESFYPTANFRSRSDVVEYETVDHMTIWGSGDDESKPCRKDLYTNCQPGQGAAFDSSMLIDGNVIYRNNINQGSWNLRGEKN